MQPGVVLATSVMHVVAGFSIYCCLMMMFVLFDCFGAFVLSFIYLLLFSALLVVILALLPTACAAADRSAGLVIGICMVGAGVVEAGSVYFSSNWAGDGCCVGRGRLNGE